MELRRYASIITTVIDSPVLSLPDAIGQGLRVDADEIRAAMGDDELYRQEFLCEFLDEAAAFLTYEQIAGCTDQGLAVAGGVTALASESRELFVGVDVGRLRDLTVVWVLAGECNNHLTRSLIYETTQSSNRQLAMHVGRSCFTTVALMELANAPFRAQFDLLAELLNLRNVRRCCVDAGGIGMQLAEQLVEQFGGHRVLPITFTPALKSQLAGGLRIAVESGSIRIPPDERIRNDWHSVERTVSESGHFRLSAPRREGSHADRFWAAALALHAGDRAAGKAEHLSMMPMQFARTGTW